MGGSLSSGGSSNNSSASGSISSSSTTGSVCQHLYNQTFSSPESADSHRSTTTYRSGRTYQINRFSPKENGYSNESNNNDKTNANNRLSPPSSNFQMFQPSNNNNTNGNVGRKQLLLNGWNFTKKAAATAFSSSTNQQLVTSNKSNSSTLFPRSTIDRIKNRSKDNNNNFHEYLNIGIREKQVRSNYMQNGRQSANETTNSSLENRDFDAINKISPPPRYTLNNYYQADSKKNGFHQKSNGLKVSMVKKSGSQNQKASSRDHTPGGHPGGLFNIFRNGILQTYNSNNNEARYDNANKGKNAAIRLSTTCAAHKYISIDEQIQLYQRPVNNTVIMNPYVNCGAQSEDQFAPFNGNRTSSQWCEQKKKEMKMCKQDLANNNVLNNCNTRGISPRAITPLSPTHKASHNRLPSFSSILSLSSSNNNYCNSEKQPTRGYALNEEEQLSSIVSSSTSSQKIFNGERAHRPHSWGAESPSDCPAPPPSSEARYTSHADCYYYPSSNNNNLEEKKYGIVIQRRSQHRQHNHTVLPHPHPSSMHLLTTDNGRAGSKRTVVQASTSELLRGLGHFIALECNKTAQFKHFEAAHVVMWLRTVDRALMLQAFINPANLVFVYMLIKNQLKEITQHCTDQMEEKENKEEQDEDDPMCTSVVKRTFLYSVNDLRALVLTCLYISYSYMGNEISYPLKPFIAESADRDNFWSRCVNIINAHSSDMLRITICFSKDIVQFNKCASSSSSEEQIP